MSKKKFSGNISGKGYYIALILCAVAIGVSGYLYYRNINDTNVNLESPATEPVSAAQNQGVEAVATQPVSEEAMTPQEVVPAQQESGKPAAVWPLEGQTAVGYAMQTLAYNQTTRDWRTHDGLDIAAEAGAAVGAAADGEVYSVYEDETMGMTVILVHQGGYSTRYASLSEDVQVSAGDQVKAGQTIGYVGASALLESGIGDHVHFAVTCSGKSVDPLEFLQQE